MGDIEAIKAEVSAELVERGSFAIESQRQNLDLVTIDGNGAVILAFGVQDWRGWLPLSWPGFVPTAASIAAAKQPPGDQLDAFVVGVDGRLHLLWVEGAHAWKGPAPVTDRRIAPPGAGIAASVQPPNAQLDVFVVGDDGAIAVVYEVDNGEWQPPRPVTAPGTGASGRAARGGGAAAERSAGRVCGGSRRCRARGLLLDNQPWQHTGAISGPDLAPPGAHLAAATQPPNDQLDVFFVDNDGAVHVFWELDNGQWRDGGTLTSSGFAPPGAPIAARVQPPHDQLDVFVIGEDQQLHLIWEVDNDPWQGPVALSKPVFVPGSAVRAINWPAISRCAPWRWVHT